MKEHGSKSVFVISPIGTPGTDIHRHASNVLTYVIKKALCEPDWTVVRADEESTPDSIGQRVVDRVIKSDLIVADLTGHNPNVFYELAVAHCFKRPVVLLKGDNLPIPFDITDQRAISYDLTDPASVDKAKNDLAKFAQTAVLNPEQLVTPLTQYDAIQAVSQKVAGGDQEALVDVLEGISSRLARLERGRTYRNVTISNSMGPLTQQSLDYETDTARKIDREIKNLQNEIDSLTEDQQEGTQKAALTRKIDELRSMRNQLEKELIENPRRIPSRDHAQG